MIDRYRMYFGELRGKHLVFEKGLDADTLQHLKIIKVLGAWRDPVNGVKLREAQSFASSGYRVSVCRILLKTMQAKRAPGL